MREEQRGRGSIAVSCRTSNVRRQRTTDVVVPARPRRWSLLLVSVKGDRIDTRRRRMSPGGTAHETPHDAAAVVQVAAQIRRDPLRLAAWARPRSRVRVDDSRGQTRGGGAARARVEERTAVVRETMGVHVDAHLERLLVDGVGSWFLFGRNCCEIQPVVLLLSRTLLDGEIEGYSYL